MIDIFDKNKQLIRVENVEGITIKPKDFYLMQCIDFSPREIQWLEQTYHIDLSILRNFEDIEISSHFLATDTQAAFHISIPFYNQKKEIEERPMFFVIAQKQLFLFWDSEVDVYLNKNYSRKIAQLQKIETIDDILNLQIEFITDYYADITENEIKKVKSLTNEMLSEKKFTNKMLNLITKYNFDNMLIKEMLIETTRVLKLYKKSSWQSKINIEKTIDREIDDLSVVSDYIQFNAERLESLKENIANKIEIEQNRIFKALTIITLCISLPTMIAGIYGMNFEYMPELQHPYGYPVALSVMLFSAILPFIYFKIKKWF